MVEGANRNIGADSLGVKLTALKSVSVREIARMQI